MSRLVRAFLENERSLKRFLARFFTRREDIEDIVQETFLRALRAEGEEYVVVPRAFFFRVARNLALNERSRGSNRLTDYMEDAPNPDVLGSTDQVTAEDRVHSQQKMAVFAEAVSLLPAQCRHVFLLRKLHGLSQKEVAERLGISTSTVEKHVAMGLVRCSEHLRQRGYEVGPSAVRPAEEASATTLSGKLALRTGSGDV